jgi:SnoaL-like domain
MPIDDDIAVRELTDRATITEVPHTYARLVDERDFAAVARVFTDDCLRSMVGNDTRLSAGDHRSAHAPNVRAQRPESGGDRRRSAWRARASDENLIGVEDLLCSPTWPTPPPQRGEGR